MTPWGGGGHEGGRNARQTSNTKRRNKETPNAHFVGHPTGICFFLLGRVGWVAMWAPIFELLVFPPSCRPPSERGQMILSFGALSRGAGWGRNVGRLPSLDDCRRGTTWYGALSRLWQVCDISCGATGGPLCPPALPPLPAKKKTARKNNSNEEGAKSCARARLLAPPSFLPLVFLPPALCVWACVVLLFLVAHFQGAGRAPAPPNSPAPRPTHLAMCDAPPPVLSLSLASLQTV